LHGFLLAFHPKRDAALDFVILLHLLSALCSVCGSVELLCSQNVVLFRTLRLEVRVCACDLLLDGLLLRLEHAVVGLCSMHVGV